MGVGLHTATLECHHPARSRSDKWNTGHLEEGLPRCEHAVGRESIDDFGRRGHLIAVTTAHSRDSTTRQQRTTPSTRVAAVFG